MARASWSSCARRASVFSRTRLFTRARGTKIGYTMPIDFGSIETQATSMAIPIPRDPDLDLTDIPRHWLANNAVGTAIASGVNLLFPQGERFFVRSVHHFMDRIEDPLLREQARAFFKQE